MAKYQEGKFIVINKKNLKKLNEAQHFYLTLLLGKLEDGNKYYVVNQDEPYAEEVLNIILKGEEGKEKES